MRRTSAIALAALMVSEVLGAAQAQSGSWCAYFSGGPTKCDFVTFEDCLKAIQGKTGLCDRNTKYLPPAGSDSSSGSKRRHHRAASQ